MLNTKHHPLIARNHWSIGQYTRDTRHQTTNQMEDHPPPNSNTGEQQAAAAATPPPAITPTPLHSGLFRSDATSSPLSSNVATPFHNPNYTTPKMQDFLLLDVTSKILHNEISGELEVPYLSSADAPQTSPVYGRLYGLYKRLMVNLVTRRQSRRGNEGAGQPVYPRYNLFFLCDTGSPNTFICAEAMRVLLGEGEVASSSSSSSSSPEPLLEETQPGSMLFPTTPEETAERDATTTKSAIKEETDAAAAAAVMAVPETLFVQVADFPVVEAHLSPRLSHYEDVNVIGMDLLVHLQTTIFGKDLEFGLANMEHTVML